MARDLQDYSFLFQDLARLPVPPLPHEGQLPDDADVLVLVVLGRPICASLRHRQLRDLAEGLAFLDLVDRVGLNFVELLL
jgi:hypothetical protein